MIDFFVADTGIGIAREDREKIFEEFVQIESELQAKGEGTGLGLPLSKRLTELLGGTISVESEVGSGSTFQVRLPVRLSPTDPETVQRAYASSSAEAPTVLFVEDNIETSFVHETSLKSSNFNLIFALNIPEARAAMRMSRPDIIVLDRFLDGEDSLFYIGELKAADYHGPILVISVIDEGANTLSDAGADAFLAKPVAPFRLENTLHRLLGNAAPNTILLADDDEVARYLLGEALTKLGYKIIEAHNGREAIQIIGNHILNGVFLDMVMPDLTGFEVLREIKRNQEMMELPVIIHSSMELSEPELSELGNVGALILTKREFSSEDGPERLRAVLAAAGIGL